MFKFLKSKTPEAEFWEYVAENADTIRDNLKEEIQEDSKLRRLLSACSDGLIAEALYPDESGNWSLIISAGGIQEYFPDVERVVAAAPNIANLDVIAFRQPDPNICDASIILAGIKFEVSETKYVLWDDHFPTDISVGHPAFPQNEEAAQQMTYLILDHVLGEYIVETMVAGVETFEGDPADRPDVDWKPVSGLFAEFQRKH